MNTQALEGGKAAQKRALAKSDLCAAFWSSKGTAPPREIKKATCLRRCVGKRSQLKR